MIIYKVVILQISYNYTEENIKEHLYGYFKSKDMAEQICHNAKKNFENDSNYFYLEHITEIFVQE